MGKERLTSLTLCSPLTPYPLLTFHPPERRRRGGERWREGKVKMT